MSRDRVADVALLLLRVVAGWMFFQSGTIKLFGWWGGMPGGGTVQPVSQIWIGAVLETIGGLAVALGLFTRPVAFVLSGEMAVAYWQFHAPQSIFPGVNMGTPAIMYCFFFFYLVFAGAGPWSLDALIARRRGEVHHG